MILDFGGVVAEEGFREGLKSIARRNGLDADRFFSTARELIYTTGYISGDCEEAFYWRELRKKTGISGGDASLRREIIGRFRLRPAILKAADDLRSAGVITAILSDQTDWLDEIEQKTAFSRHFDFVFNSFVLRKSKRDPSVFLDVCKIIGIPARQVLFFDDDEENVQRAAKAGLNSVLFRDPDNFKRQLGVVTKRPPRR